MEQNKIYKRKTREVSQATRDKISAKLKGVKKSVSHCQNISKSLSSATGGYWSHIPPSGNQCSQNPYNDA